MKKTTTIMLGVFELIIGVDDQSLAIGQLSDETESARKKDTESTKSAIDVAHYYRPKYRQLFNNINRCIGLH